ncbi:NADase-type glycan-binding domain-containing protein [Kitasatospora sp. NPDC052896]|uniref:NADase-type glycan-binding domain-containing protein n=1 Tax=Kitasatospora sp. NPDC052896 TaxID=3364061 RepID=UPI0037C9938A
MDFCGSCGAFQGWAKGEDRSKESVEVAGEPERSEKPGKPAEAEKPGKPAEAGKPEEPGKPVDAGEPAEAGKSGESEQAEPQPETIELPVDERAHALIVPVPDSAPVESPVAPVLPGLPAQSGPRVRSVVEGEPIDGIACSWCSTVNPPDRHFCRRCATPFQSAEPQRARRPWWRRLLDFRGREQPWAGQRPRLRQGPWQLVRWVVTAVLVITLVICVSVWSGPAYQAVSDHFAHRVSIPPVGVTADYSDQNHPAKNVLDGYNNTWWGDGYSGVPNDLHLDFTFGQASHLLDVVITPGVSPDSSDEQAEATPHQIDLVATQADGKTVTTPITMAQFGPQTFALHLTQVVKVRLEIKSAYNTMPDKEIAVAEVEFFGTTPAGSGNGS